jgi:uncharacterized oxidoreductase
MNTKKNTILITGGATGIGFELAKALSNEGNEVIICSRREEKLKEAKSKLPKIHSIVCDISKEKERISLFNWTISNFRNINILINNAGIMRSINLKEGAKELSDGEDEIDTNLKALIHLSSLFIPHFLKQKEAAIINVSSGLAFIPLAMSPVYCATKAAVHSFTLSLRHQLKNTPIKVFEIAPPLVDTELMKEERNNRDMPDRGIPPSELAKAVLNSMKKDEYELAYGMADGLRKGARDNPEEVFNRMNK